MTWDYPIWAWKSVDGWRAYSPTRPGLMAVGRTRLHAVFALFNAVELENREGQLA